MPFLLAGVGAVLVALVVFWIRAERGKLLLPSTRRFLKEAGFNWNALHGYIYGRWTRQYVHLLLNPPAPPKRKAIQWLSEHYHGKILTHEHAEAIVSNTRDIPLQDLEQIIPYPVARNLVLKGPPDVAAYECVCRHNRAEYCRPTQVCMVIGQPIVDFVLEHHPKISRRLTQTEALELLRAEHERGHVHSAWFKDAMLGRFYAICNCCKCCCAGIETMNKWETPMMASSGYVAEVNAESCDQCGTCVETCPFNALSLNDCGVMRDWERCMGCGACEATCPSESVTLVRDERKGIPLDVRALRA
jgi:ferredoxin